MNCKLLVCILAILLSNFNPFFAQERQPQSTKPNSADFFKTVPPLEGEIPQWIALMYSDNPNVWEVDRLYNAYYRKHKFEKTTHTQNYKFWRKLLNKQHLIDAAGFIQSPSEIQLLEEERKAKDLFEAAQHQQRMLPWTVLGPLNTQATDGGPEVSWQTNIYTLDQSISNPNTMYCGTETGGIYKSIDKGLHWTEIGSTISDGGIQSICIDPTNANIVFIGTSNHIYRSTDGGMTINSVLFQGGLQPRDFYINPSNNQIVLAATNQGVYRSINGGLSWTQLFSEDGWDLEGKPGTPNTVYLLMTKSSEQHIKFYRSTNAGASFNEYDTGWFAGSAAGLNNSNNGARMAVTPADPNRIYVVLLGNDVSYTQDNNWIGVYKSMDSGTSWTLPAGDPGGPFDSNHICLSSFNPNSTGYDQGYYNLGIAVSATNPDELLVGCLNLFKSTDGAASYEWWGGYGGNGPGWQHPDIQEIEINGSDVWVASDGGLNYYTPNFSSQESRINGITGADYWGFDNGWNMDVVVGGRYHNGNAAHIETYPNGQFLRLGGGEAPTGYINKGENLKVWHSDIGGDLLPMDINDPVGGISNLALYPNEAYYNENKSDLKTYPHCYNHFLLGRDNVLWKSENGGGTFYEVHTFGNIDDPLVDIEISRSNPDVIYVVQKVSGSTLLWKTTDGGQNWTSSTVPGAVGGGMFITLSPTNELEIWAAHSKNSNTNKILKSDNGGTSWTDWTTAELSGLWPEDIMVQGGTDGGVYLSTHLAMYYRNDTHNDWQLYNTGLPAGFRLMQMRPFYRDSKVRAAGNRGIWESSFYENSTPIAQPTVDKLVSTCPLDTFYFEDYSMLDHTGASWTWSFSPSPMYVESTTIRNPRVVFGAEGQYSFTLTISNPSGTDTKSYTNEIEIFGNECLIDTVAGSALECFSDGDYAQLPDMGLSAATHLTISAWVKPEGIIPEYTGIVMNDGNAAGFNFFSNNNTIAYHWPGGAWWWNSGLVAPADEWSHIALVADPTGISIYVNGIEARHNTSLNPVDITTMKIGSYQGWGGRNFKGLIDEVCIWNRALTQEEIREHRHLTHNLAQDPSIYAYYQFNETGSVIYDKIAARNTTFSGGAVRSPSTAPVAGGVVRRMHISGSGNYSFLPTGVQIEFPSTGSYPDGELVAFQLHTPPDVQPSGVVIPESGYYIINNYGTNTTFAELKSITLGNTEITNVEAANVDNFSLYKRQSNAAGNTWTIVGDEADAATAGNNGSVTFETGNGITSFSQFIIHKDNCPDILFVNVQPIDGDTLQAAMTIVSNGQEVAGSDIVFHAGNCISLDAGFEVESGAEFLAAIAACTSMRTVINTEKEDDILSAKIEQRTQGQFLAYELQKSGTYSAYIKHVAKGQAYHLLHKRTLNIGKHQIALEKEQFPKGLYVLILEQEGKVVSQQFIQVP